MGQGCGGNALRTDGIFHRVFDDYGIVDIMGGRMSIGVSEPERIEQEGYLGHVVIVDIIRAPKIFACNYDPI
jgi:hypothetical protein